LLEPFKCNPDDSCVEVARKLRDSMQRHIYVVNEEDWPIGIISTTDINNKIVAEGKDPNEVKAREIMSEPIDVYDVSEDEVRVYKEMISKKRLTCAVVENKRFVGILTLNRLIGYITGIKNGNR